LKDFMPYRRSTAPYFGCLPSGALRLLLRRWAGSLSRVLIVCGLVSVASAAAPANSLPKVDTVSVPKSVFTDDASFGKDPFFPKSSRRAAAAPVVTNPQTAEVPDRVFILKGISVNKDRRLALVNNYTFAAGEEAEIKIEGRSIRVRCLEVRERSVVISVRGASKEIFLRPGI
jgi:hypothetical protein